MYLRRLRFTREARQEETLEGYRTAAYTAWIQLAAQAEKPQKFPTFDTFIRDLGLLPDEGTPEPSQGSEVASSGAASTSEGGARGKRLRERTSEEINAEMQKVADLDMRRIKKHMDAGRWHLVPEHLRPSEADPEHEG